ncbi:Thg1 C terminal domain-containing protein [Phakopsora pachyrhizi]|uniref:tRNA(His) guanylyltransferase n=1 Tax=Phakopsora pachyrhizi TaxID=170000 RepID=A0AAV0AIW0_PHAPC|nr:Thg1 C terminal domain-containing protein [Phakopsora pachyrhizi]CAH7668399.1 Thg1 C terminal domain-domain-containing protein [Phakopsora pachyrhizi]
MANSSFQYVRKSELDDRLLPNTFLIVRLDGKGFTSFSEHYKFEKPNDLRAIDLMNRSARLVLESELGRGSSSSSSKIFLAFGQSDEYSFAIGRQFKTFNRRSSKVLTTILSTFTAGYVHLWSEYFPNNSLDTKNLPSFDGRIIQYSTYRELRDYFKWRQTDVHINNLYNTTFWALVNRAGRSTSQSHQILKGTVSSQKHQILFEQFKINYNHSPSIFRKGSILIRSITPTCDLNQIDDKNLVRRESSVVRILHEDLINDTWWYKNFDSLS